MLNPLNSVWEQNQKEAFDFTAPYLRRAREMDEFIPYLYLKVRQRRKGISTNDFSGVLSQLLGKGFKSDLAV